MTFMSDMINITRMRMSQRHEQMFKAYNRPSRSRYDSNTKANVNTHNSYDDIWNDNIFILDYCKKTFWQLARSFSLTCKGYKAWNGSNILNEFTIYYIQKFLAHMDFQNAADSHQSNFPLPVAFSAQDKIYFICACKGFDVIFGPWTLKCKYQYVLLSRIKTQPSSQTTDSRQKTSCFSSKCPG